MNNVHYRVVRTAGKNRLHRTYFKTYTSALRYFKQASRGLHPMGYAELQELEKGNFLTVEQAVGGGLI